MNRQVPVVLAILFAIGCSPAEQLATATTSTSQVTSTSLATTITSTMAASTTTLPPTTTTSTTLLAGNWGERPLIVTPIGDLAVGWWDGSQWVRPGSETTLPIRGGEDYQTVVLGSVGRTVGSEEIRGCDIRPTSFPGVDLGVADLELPETDSLGWSPHGVAISAPWNVTPYEITSRAADDPAHVAAAARLLAGLGLDIESPLVRQVVDADLNGDGMMESLVVADKNDPPVVNDEGYYSVVFLVNHQQGDEIIVEKSVNPPGENGDFPISYRIGSIADLNGDGVMEVVLSGLEIEGSDAAIYEWIQHEARFARRLEAGCGL